MGAYSVTGVGQGSALGMTKGGDNMSLGVDKLIGPRIVYAGSVALVGGAATWNFPATVPGVAGDYVVITNATSHSSATMTTSTITFAGTGTQTVSFIVVRVNTATVDEYPTTV